jgi:predicted permease
MSDWSECVRSRLAGLHLAPAREAEIVEELSQHLEARYEELCVTADPEEARRLAIEELLGTDALARRMRSLGQAHIPASITPGEHRRFILADCWQDLRYAARMLRKQPGFAAAAVITLALGIGANTALFSLVNATLLQRMPVAERQRLFYVFRGEVGGVFSYPLYKHLRDGNEVFDGLAAWGGISASLNAGDTSELVSGVIVTGNFFDVLGVRAERGRLLTVADDVTPGAHPVVVISHDFCQSHFADEPEVIGREIRLNGHIFTIIGVTPAGFPGPQLGTMRHLYVPMMMQAIMRPPRAGYSGDLNPDLLARPTNSWLFGVGRLEAGVRPEQARATLETLAASFVRTLPQSVTPPKIPLLPIDEGDPAARQQMRSVALLLGGVVGAVLLIACANIANLLLSRTASRRRELAVRLALGASRARVVRQLLTESIVLSLVGGACGVAAAGAIVQMVPAALPPAETLPFPIQFSIDRHVLLFSLALSFVAGIIFGAAPALKASRPGLVPALKDASAGDERGSRIELKKILVIAEVALAVPLLIAAGLFVRSLYTARSIDTGFDADKLVSARLNINLLRYTRAQGREFYHQVAERVERVAGVESASMARVPVLEGGGRVLSIHVEGRGATHDRVMAEGTGVVTQDRTIINANVVGPRFFRTLGIPLMIGRDFDAQDVDGRPWVVVINETTAKLQFPGDSPLGNRVSVDGPNGPWREVIGVVRDSKYGTLGEDAVPVVYLPLAQNHETGMTLYVRASVPPASLVSSIRREIQQLEPNLPVPDIETTSETIAASLYPAQAGAWLLALFGGLALLLAAVGIYGVLSFSISRRTREMGIRLALGAARGDVFLLVVRDGMLLVAVGLVVGVAAGLAGTRWLASFLYGISPSDLPTFAATTAVLTMVALAACAIPATRAMRVQPIAALRYE